MNPVSIGEIVIVLIVYDMGLLTVREICKARVTRALLDQERFEYYVVEEFAPRVGVIAVSDEGITWSREEHEVPFRVAVAL